MTPIPLSVIEARRLVIAAQQPVVPRPIPTRPDLLDLIRRITCLQIDPINLVLLVGMPGETVRSLSCGRTFELSHG
ncbi:MAG: hypothetical protein KJ046_06590 [Anaerolineae bacterium]|nr:hypothetical protein [Anaerolineae bacterium]